MITNSQHTVNGEVEIDASVDGKDVEQGTDAGYIWSVVRYQRLVLGDDDQRRDRQVHASLQRKDCKQRRNCKHEEVVHGPATLCVDHQTTKQCQFYSIK